MLRFVIHLKIIKHNVFLNNTFKQSKDFHLITIKLNIVVITKTNILIIIIFRIIKKHFERDKSCRIKFINQK